MADKTSFFNQTGLAGVAYSAQAFDSAVGQALKYVRLNAAEGSMEFRTPAEMQADLGLAVGVNIQAYDADLDTWGSITPSANAQSLVSAATYAAMRVLLDLEAGTDFYSIAAADAAFEPLDGTILKDADIGVTVEAADATILKDADIGSTVQAYDADLTTWGSITPSANAQSLVSAATYAAMRVLLDLEIGTDVQAHNATLASLAALGTAGDKMAYTTGVDTWAEATITAAGRALIDDATNTAQRTTLGLGTAAVVNTGVANGNVPLMDATGYPAADGSQITNVGGGDMVLLATASPSAVASVDFTSVLSTAYKSYLLSFYNLKPATDDMQLWLRISENNGSTWETSFPEYEFVVSDQEGGSSTGQSSTGDSKILLCGESAANAAIGNTTNESASGHVWISDPMNAAEVTYFNYECAYQDAGDDLHRAHGSGKWDDTVVTNAVQLLFESGNIADGEVRLYGIKEA